MCFVQVLTPLAAAAKHFLVSVSEITLIMTLVKARHSSIERISLPAAVLKQPVSSHCGTAGTQTRRMSP